MMWCNRWLGEDEMSDALVKKPPIQGILYLFRLHCMTTGMYILAILTELEIADSRRHCVSSFLKNTFVRKATWPWSPQWATWFPTWQVSIAMMGTRRVWQMVTTDMALAQWHPALRPSSLMQWLHITLTTSCHPFHQRRCTKVTQLTWTNLTSHCWQHGAQRWMWASTRRRKARRRKASECESAQVQWYKTYCWSQ